MLLASAAAPWHRVGCGHLRCRLWYVRRGPAALAGLASLANVTAPCLCSQRDHRKCGHRCRRNRPAAPAGLASLMRLAAARLRGQRGHPQHNHQRRAISTSRSCVVRGVAPRGCGGCNHPQRSHRCVQTRACCCGRPCISCERYGALSSCPVWTPAVQPSAARDMGQRHQQALTLSRARRREAIARQPCCARSALPLAPRVCSRMVRRACSRMVQPSGREGRARRASEPYLSLERCRTRTSCRL